jgi:hypothetical protein
MDTLPGLHRTGGFDLLAGRFLSLGVLGTVQAIPLSPPPLGGGRSSYMEESPHAKLARELGDLANEESRAELALKDARARRDKKVKQAIMAGMSDRQITRLIHKKSRTIVYNLRRSMNL